MFVSSGSVSDNGRLMRFVVVVADLVVGGAVANDDVVAAVGVVTEVLCCDVWCCCCCCCVGVVVSAGKFMIKFSAASSKVLLKLLNVDALVEKDDLKLVLPLLSNSLS